MSIINIIGIIELVNVIAAAWLWAGIATARFVLASDEWTGPERVAVYVLSMAFGPFSVLSRAIFLGTGGHA